MKNLIKMLAVAGLMTAGVAQASVPADFNAAPGVLFVNWHASSTMAGKANPMLEVRDESGDLVASVHANLMGTQQVQIPSRTQGNLDETDDHHEPEVREERGETNHEERRGGVGREL